jgi:rhamnosyltransferase
MNKSCTCAVIITFRPHVSVLDNLAKVRPQVDGLVVVDNGSSPELLAPFQAAAREMGFTLIEHGVNRGIAEALNVGVRWAKSQGFDRVVLLDQDSTVTPGFVGAMTLTYNEHPRSDEIAIVMPRYKNREDGEVSKTTYIAADGAPLEVMTSGSFMPVSVFDSCGEFREDLFIDRVDHEFGFRVRERGYIVVVSEQAYLLHIPGSPRKHSFLGLMTFTTTHHSAMRRYYIMRNGIVMVRQYWDVYPAWSRGVAKSLLVLPIPILLAETQKWMKLRNMLLGTIHALRGRMGSADVG